MLSLGADLDGGRIECHHVFGAHGTNAEGFENDKIKDTATLKGKAGTLVISATGAVYDIGFGNSDVWEGTWKIVRGTDKYAGLSGGGTWKGADNRAKHALAARYAGSVNGG